MIVSLGISVPYTKPLLPDFDMVSESLRAIWSSGIVANRGPREIAFERALSGKFGWENFVLTSSCTLAMYLLLAASKVEGEAIVSSFTHPATLQAARLGGLKPVSVDIDPTDLTIDVDAVESSIGPSTSCILATHVFGHPCDVERLEAIAKQRGLALFYDGASAVGVGYAAESISSFGDGIAFSFHATKLLTTIEGGAAVCRNANMGDVMMSLRNFGISDSGLAKRRGVNAKMNEIGAAIGTLGLGLLDREIAARGRVFGQYAERLRRIGGVRLLTPRIGTTSNFSCAPIRIETGGRRNGGAVRVASRLRELGIDARCYFAGKYQHADSGEGGVYPHAVKARRDVLCLPMFGALTQQQVDAVIDGVRYALD